MKHTSKRLLALLLSVLMIASLMPVMALADVPVTSLSGSGTQTDPFIINNIDDLKFFRDQVNGGNTYNGKWVALNANIDLNNELWTPIGVNGSNGSKAFCGTFDGDNHTISNLKVNISSGIAGLFGSTGYSEVTTTIKNLYLVNVDVKGVSNVGGAVGWITGTAVFDNIHVSGNVKIEATVADAGGIVGHSVGALTVTNCSVLAAENSGSYIKARTSGGSAACGGIVGFAGNEASGRTHSVTSCSVSNVDLTSYNRIGGIVGMMQYAKTYSGSTLIVKDNTVRNINIAVYGPTATSLGDRHDAQAGLIVGSSTVKETRSNHYYSNNTYSGTCSVTAETTHAADIIPTQLYGLWTLGSQRVADDGKTTSSWYGLTTGDCNVTYASAEETGEVMFDGAYYKTFLSAYHSDGAGKTGSSEEKPFKLMTDVGYSLAVGDKIYVEGDGHIFYPRTDEDDYEVKTTEISDTVKMYELVLKSGVVHVASLTVGDTVKGYATLEKAFAAAPKDGTACTITLLENCSVGAKIITNAGNNITLELNGKTAEMTAISGAMVYSAGTLTVQDNTDTNADGTGTGELWVHPATGNAMVLATYGDNSVININSGTVLAESSDGTAQTVYTSKAGKVNANGGLIEAKVVSGQLGYALRINNLEAAKEGTEFVLNGATLKGNSDKSYLIYNQSYFRGARMSLVKGTIISTGKDAGKYNEVRTTGNDVSYDIKDAVAPGSFRVKVDNTTYKVVDYVAEIDSVQYKTLDKAKAAYPNGLPAGVFYEDPSAYVDSDYVVVKRTDTDIWDVVRKPDVAEIGTTGYTSLDKAVAAAYDGDTIVMLKNTNLAGDLTISKSIKLNLNGSTVDTGTSNILVEDGTLDVIGTGTITGKPSSHKLIYLKGSTDAEAENYSNLTIGKDVTVEATDAYGIMVSSNNNCAYGVNIEVNGKVDSPYGIYVNGQINKITGNVPNITINGEVFNGIYAAGYANWTLNAGATMTGEAPLSLKSGNFVINGGTYTATGAYADPAVGNNNGSEDTGAALSLTSNDTYAKILNVTVNGGTFISTYGNAVYEGIALDDGEPVAAASYAVLSINGGMFKGADGKAVVAINEAAEKKVLAGGFYSTEPDVSYIADSYMSVATVAGTEENTAGYLYEVVPTVEITYDANGGEGSMTAGAAPKGYLFNLAGNGFTREYFDFVGWSTNKYATESEVVTSGTFTKATTLYAIWKHQTAEITFNNNGGSGEMANQTVDKNVATALTHCTFAAPIYREFIGWALSNNGTKAYDDEENITITENTTLYALWGLLDATISFNANGGSGEMADMPVKMTVATALKENAFTRDGYTFMGWATTADGAVAYKNTASIIVYTANTTLYAVWKENVVIPTNPTDPEPKPVVPGVDTIVEPGAGENKTITEDKAESIVNGETNAEQAKQIVAALNNTMVIGDESLVKVAEEKAAQVIAAAETTDNEPINAEVAREKLSAKVPDVATKDITIVVEPYFESEIKGYNLDASGNWVIDVDLEAVCAIKATTDPANMTDANTVLLSKESVDLNTLGDNINVKIELKEAVKITEKAVIVMHTHGGKTFFYNGTVSENGTVVTFVNPDDFSEFIIMKEIPPEYVAKVGDQYFKTLKDAIDNANGKTVYLVQNCNESLTFSKEITFTLDTNGKNFTGSINAGSGYYKVVSGNTYKIGFYKCTGTQEVAIGNGSFEMYVNGHSIGQVRLEKSGNGWKIIKSNGKAISSDLGDVWKYENGCFVQTSTQKISRGFFLWNILFGRKDVTTTNYITFTDALRTSGGAESYAKVKLMQPYARAEHNYQWVSNGNGTHSMACIHCGTKTGDPVACKYENGTCKYCGSQDPKTTGYINVNVNVHKTGLLFFKLYIADIKVSSDIVHIKKVEYSVGTSGLKYTTGNKVMSTKPINDLIIVVTASDGAHGFRYNTATGVVTPYDLM